MVMRLAVSLITALIVMLVGAFQIFAVLPGRNVYGASTWTIILTASSALVIVIIVISSVVSGLLAHVIQTRSGISPWLVGPLTIVAVTAVAIVAMFLSVSILTTLIGAARHPVPAPRQPPAANRRAGGDKRMAHATLINFTATPVVWAPPFGGPLRWSVSRLTRRPGRWPC